MAAVSEWGDPHSVRDVVETGESDAERRRREVEQAVADAYAEQHTTTPLDAGSRFSLQSLEEVETEGDADVYEFRVKRFLRRSVAGTFTGTVTRSGESWSVEYDSKPGLVDRIRTLF